MSEYLDLMARVLYSGERTEIYPLLDDSLNPRSPELLFEEATE